MFHFQTELLLKLWEMIAKAIINGKLILRNPCSSSENRFVKPKELKGYIANRQKLKICIAKTKKPKKCS